MNKSNLVTFLTSNFPSEELAIQEIVENCKTKVFLKDEFLLRPNEYCKHTFFVEEGLICHYSIDDKGKEHVLQFATENWFVGDRESQYFNQPSIYYIQALEESKVALIDEKFIQQLSLKIPAFIDFNSRLLHNHIRHLQKRINQLLGVSAESRYLEFIRMYPDVLQRVPQWMVASYLGITPESLSRVRKDLVKKETKGP